MITKLDRRALLYAVCAGSLALVAACGGSDDSSSSSSSSATSSSATSSSASPSAAAGGSGSKELTGSVAETDFVIGLVDAGGAPVTTLPAGTYTVKVKDPSKIHNFHLTGPNVEQRTGVPDTVDTTWTVTLSAGTYTYKCDPHAKMTGTFVVT